MQDRDAIEKALLFSVVRDHNWRILVQGNITRDCFTIANQPIYDYLKSYTDHNEYPELSIMSYEFKIDDIAMSEYTSIKDVKGLCNALRKTYLTGEVKYELKNLNNFVEELNTNPEDFINRMGATVLKLKTIGSENRTVGLLDNIEETLEADPNNSITTGFPELDKILVGWQRGEELVVFVARTGQGKSWLGLKFALAAARTGERVGIYSGEMSLRQLQERIICCGKTSYTMSKEESAKQLIESDIDIRVLTQSELRRRANINDIEEMIVRDNLTMVVIDQLSLMEDVNSKYNIALRQQYGNISKDLLSLSQKYSIPIILLAQSNRAGGQEVNGPRTENIAESDTVGQDATRVITMKNENGVLTLNITKNRYGKSDDTCIKYEVDYGINKYKYIREAANTPIRKVRPKQAFGGGSTF